MRSVPPFSPICRARPATFYRGHSPCGTATRGAFPERHNLLLMPKRRSQRHSATPVDSRSVTLVETVPLDREAALIAQMREGGYAVWTRRAGAGVVTIQFILCA